MVFLGDPFKRLNELHKRERKKVEDLRDSLRDNVAFIDRAFHHLARKEREAESDKDKGDRIIVDLKNRLLNLGSSLAQFTDASGKSAVAEPELLNMIKDFLGKEKDLVDVINALGKALKDEASDDKELKSSFESIDAFFSKRFQPMLKALDDLKRNSEKGLANGELLVASIYENIHKEAKIAHYTFLRLTSGVADSWRRLLSAFDEFRNSLINFMQSTKYFNGSNGVVIPFRHQSPQLFETFKKQLEDKYVLLTRSFEELSRQYGILFNELSSLKEQVSMFLKEGVGVIFSLERADKDLLALLKDDPFVRWAA